jgi:putative ABC transport system substrate-binding protein
MTVASLLAIILILAWPAAVEAQPVKVHRIGTVSPLSPSPEPPQVRVCRQALRELGYVERGNVVIETRFAEGCVERLPELFAELIRLRVDVLVTGSVAGALAAKEIGITIPPPFLRRADHVVE